MLQIKNIWINLNNERKLRKTNQRKVIFGQYFNSSCGTGLIAQSGVEEEKRLFDQILLESFKFIFIDARRCKSEMKKGSPKHSKKKLFCFSLW